MTEKRRYTNPKGREVSKVAFPTVTDSKIDYTPLYEIAKELYPDALDDDLYPMKLQWRVNDARGASIGASK